MSGKKLTKKEQAARDEEKRVMNANRQARYRERQAEKIELLEKAAAKKKPLEEVTLESRVLILERRLAALERRLQELDPIEA